MKTLALICLFTVFAGLFYQLINEERFDYNSVVLGFSLGLVFGLLELFLFPVADKRFRQWSFTKILLFKTLLYTTIIAKTKPKKPTSVILQHNTRPALEISDRNVMRGNQPPRYTNANEHQWAEDLTGKAKLKLKDRLILSAANTVIPNKAWINVASCRNIYTQSPAIEFLNDRSDHFGGEVEFWLENLTGPKNLQFLIRITGASTGNVTLSLGASLPTATSLLPVTISGSMDMVLGSILQIPSNHSGGLGLISLNVQFHNAEWAYWHFVDINITEVT